MNAEDKTEPTPASAQMLKALNNNYRKGKLAIYAGTVSDKTKAQRRAKNKVARKQRKVNRQNGSGR